MCHKTSYHFYWTKSFNYNIVINQYLDIKLLISLALSQKKNFDSSELKGSADDNFKFDEKWQKVLQMCRKHCGKRRNCSLRAISPFPTVFSKDLHCRHVKTRACLGKG